MKAWGEEALPKELPHKLGVDEGKPKASRVIGLDEFSVKKRIFDTTISDLEGRKVLGSVEGSGKTNLEKYFSALPDPEIVEVIVMDMHELFRQAVQMCLPRATIVVDKFLVIIHINQALDKVRTRLQSRESKGRRWLLFHSRYLLLRKAKSLIQLLSWAGYGTDFKGTPFSSLKYLI